MTFWSENPAAPTLWTTLSPFMDRSPRFLRPSQPPTPPISWKGRGAIKRLFGTQSDLVAAFLTSHYRGSDWRLSNTDVWIRTYLRDPDIIALGYFEESDASGRLLGTIFAVPFLTTGSSNVLQTSNGGFVRSAVVIEGLCVHSDLRSHGLAGFLLSHIDSFVTRTKGSTAFFYSRELSTRPLMSTALCADMYAFKKCTATATTSTNIRTMPWHDFERLWISNAPRWSSTSSVPCIVSLVPSNLRNDLLVFIQNGLVIVVSNTQRVSQTQEPIYEVQWCGILDRDGVLSPATETQDFKLCLDSVAAVLGRGILFVCGALVGCNISTEWEGWTYGTSGAHALFIYNYMPPAFGTCRIHIIRSEL